MRTALLAALIGVVHVHHAPSHDSEAPFEEVLRGAFEVGLDFVVLTEHTEAADSGPLPAADRAGSYPRPQGGALLVLVGVEVPTRDGHLLAFDVSEIPTPGMRPGAEVIEEIHARGGFAVVPHPFSHGGWKDWSADFDGLEVHNNATALRRFVGPLLPIHLVRYALDPGAVLRRVLHRPHRALERWEELLAQGRPVAAFSGADSHRNLNLAGWALDPYARMFGAVQMVCPDAALEADAVWLALRSARCDIFYAVHADRAEQAEAVGFPSGRVELQLDGGDSVLEVRQPPFVRR